MKTKTQTSFEEFASTRGGAFPLPPFDQKDSDAGKLSYPFWEFNISCKVFENEVNKQGVLFTPYVGLLAFGPGNALATYYANTHIAALDMNLCANLYCHFSGLMSHPKIFEGLGDPGKDSERILWNNENEGPELKYLGNLDEHETWGPISRDPVRRKFGEYLYLWALRFIVYHEVGHLAQGHIHLLKKENMSMCLYDSADIYWQEKSTTLIRALEQQADIHAVERLVNTLAIDTLREPTTEARNQAISLNVMAMMFAVSTVFRMWCKGKKAIDSSDNLTHPHPAVRYIGLIEASRKRLKEFELDTKSWTDGIFHYIHQSFMADQVLGCNLPIATWDDQREVLLQEFNNINAQFRKFKLYSKLQDFTFTKLRDDPI